MRLPSSPAYRASANVIGYPATNRIARASRRVRLPSPGRFSLGDMLLAALAAFATPLAIAALLIVHGAPAARHAPALPSTRVICDGFDIVIMPRAPSYVATAEHIGSGLVFGDQSEPTCRELITGNTSRQLLN